jgi:hypothetical protein
MDTSQPCPSPNSIHERATMNGVSSTDSITLDQLHGAVQPDSEENWRREACDMKLTDLE